jgi:hypothetical protein
LWELIGQLGRVPRRLIWDNEPGIGRGQRGAEGVASFMGTMGARLVLLPPGDPESKGVVERRNGWFEISFMPARTLALPADFNDQLGVCLQTANARAVRRIKAAPVDRSDADCAAMFPLPPVPLHLGWRNRVRLGRDHYVRVDTNDDAVDPAVRRSEWDHDLGGQRLRGHGRGERGVPRRVLRDRQPSGPVELQHLRQLGDTPVGRGGSVDARCVRNGRRRSHSDHTTGDPSQ